MLCAEADTFVITPWRLVPVALLVTATVLQELRILKPGIGEQAEDLHVSS